MGWCAAVLLCVALVVVPSAPLHDSKTRPRMPAAVASDPPACWAAYMPRSSDQVGRVRAL